MADHMRPVHRDFPWRGRGGRDAEMPRRPARRYFVWIDSAEEELVVVIPFMPEVVKKLTLDGLDRMMRDSLRDEVFRRCEERYGPREDAVRWHVRSRDVIDIRNAVPIPWPGRL